VDEHFATPTASTAGVHVCESLRFFPFNVLARAIFGRDIERNGDLIVLQQLCDDYQDLLSCVFRSNSLRFKWQRYIPSKINRKFDEFWSRWCRICDAYILGEVIVEDKANLMASLATAFQDHPGHMDRRDAIYQTVAEALFANLDVSVGSTCWALADVASRPPEQERLRSYVQGICYDSSISDLHYNKLSEMEDVGFFLKESARMHPIFPVTVPEKTPYGTTMVLGNYIIPGGTPVCLDSYAINRHPAFWKDPESFRPDRFKEDPGLSRFLSRYGMGPRKCLGFRYANMFMSLMLIQVVSRFRLETPPDPPQYEKFTFVAPDSVIRFVPLKQ
jgi:cytochrome P450